MQTHPFIRFTLCSVWLIVFAFYGSFAQEQSTNKRAQQSYEKAASLLRNQQHSAAIAALEQAIALDDQFASPRQQLADIYRRQKDYQKAIPLYQQVVDIAPALTPLTYFGMGESLLHVGRYAEALSAFEQYKKTPGLSKESLSLTNKFIADCEFSIQSVQEAGAKTLHNAGTAINSEMDEYFPKLTADQNTIIFTRKTDNRENFYESTRDSAGNWQEAHLLLGEINSALYNEGAHCISPDGKYLFFTGCNRPDGLGSCDIYVSRREGDGWGTPHNIGAPINTGGWEAQPALSADGKTLYFVSNRRGGQGGYDIWRSTLQSNGAWGTPQNLGPQINTPYDESSPYIHADNETLYFASNGWPGLGNKDIFKSRIDANKNWQTPKNLGYPINDHHEQTALSVSMNGQIAFYSTRRQDAIGGLDIYYFDLPQETRPYPVAYLNGTITDADSAAPVTAEVTITDINTNEVLYHDQADFEDGTFLAPLPFGGTYALHVKQPGYLFFSENYPLNDSAHVNDAYEVNIALSRIKVGQTETLNNIFFDINKFELLPQSQSDLENLIEFLNLNQGISVEIGGHTDNTGLAQLNQTLSENRARAVHDYLVRAGIHPGRLRYKGYGMNVPVADNDTPEGRQANRRTDFKIIE